MYKLYFISQIALSFLKRERERDLPCCTVCRPTFLTVSERKCHKWSKTLVGTWYVHANGLGTLDSGRGNASERIVENVRTSKNERTTVLFYN